MIQIDIWGGDLHQKLCETKTVDDWTEASKIIEQYVEAGMLVNVLHIDFKTPLERQNEVNAAMTKLAKLEGGE
jgi:hypothetical protein